MSEAETKRAPARWIGLLLASGAVWAVVVYACVYPKILSGLTNPVWPELPTAFAPNRSWAAAPCAALLLLAAFGVGRRILRFARIEWAAPVHADFVGTLLGLSAMGTASLLLGAARAFGSIPVLIFWLVGLAVGIRDILDLGGRIARAAGSLRREKPTLVTVACALVLGMFAVVGWIAAVAPETSTDALNAHLFATSQYAAAGRFIELPSYESHHVPELGHMLFLPLWHLFGDVGPKALVFLQGVMIVCLAAIIANDVAGRRAAWIAALAAASTPALLSSSTMAYTDVQLALFGSAALWVAVRYGQFTHGAAVAGALAGAAAASKYLGALTIIVSALLVVWSCARLGKGKVWSRAQVISLAHTAVGAAVVCAPFYLKNWIVLGNPFYPLFPGVLGSYRYSPDQISALLSDSLRPGKGHGPVSLVLLPWNMTVHGEKFQGFLGGLFLAVLPFFPVIRKNPLARGIALAALGFFAIFAAGQHTLRWFLAAVPLLAALVGVIVEQVAALGRAGRVGQTALSGFVVASALLHAPFFYQAWLTDWFYYEVKEVPARVVLGGESRSAYLTRKLPAYALVERFQEEKTPNPRVLAIPEWDAGQTPTWFGAALVRNFDATRIVNAAVANEAPNAIFDTLRAAGITHLLLRRDSDDGRLSKLNEESLFGQRFVEPVASSGAYSLYRLEARRSLPVLVDLAARLQGATIEPANQADPLVKKYAFRVGDGSERLTVTVLAGGSVAFALENVPAGARFQADLAMPWRSGDGATALLEFVEAARTTTLVRQPLVPGDTRWAPVDVDLSAITGRSGKLVLKTLAGPAGDAVADWVGWAGARVVAPADAIERSAKMFVALDLLGSWASAVRSPTGTGEPLVRELEVERGGTKEKTIMTLPGGEIAFDLTVPSGMPVFEAQVAMALPGGDGAVAVARFQDDSGSTELVRMELEPAPSQPGSADPGWQTVRSDLSALAGRKGKLVLACEAGARGDAVADWLGWAQARVVGVRGVGARQIQDLLSRFESAKRLPADQVKKLDFARAGQMRQTIVTLSRTTIAFPVEIPATKPVFEAAVAMPLSKGDGAVAVVQFIEGGRVFELGRQPLQPMPGKAVKAPDPGWTPFSVDLAKFAGHRGELVLTTDPGPSGKAEADWIGWASPRLVGEGVVTAQNK